MVTLPAYEAYNVWAFVVLFIVPSSISLSYLYMYLPETRGKESYEIVEALKQKKIVLAYVDGQEN